MVFDNFKMNREQINNHRQARLLQLLDKKHPKKHGQKRYLAEKLDRSHQQVSCWLISPKKQNGDKNPSYRPISDDYARKIEDVFGMPEGWIDDGFDADKDQESHIAERAINYRSNPNIKTKPSPLGKAMPIVSKDHVIELPARELPALLTGRWSIIGKKIGDDISTKFVFEDTSSLMNEPGTEYVVDVALPPAPGKLALCRMAGIAIVGTLQSGLDGWVLTFKNPINAPVKVANDAIVGIITAAYKTL